MSSLLPHRRWARITASLAAVVLVLAVAGCFFVTRAIDEAYSSDWQSTDSEHARRRGVFVKAPIVTPAVLRASEAMDLRVTDAWVERPTHIEYRWGILRREVRDSQFRAIVHLQKMPHADSIWTDISRRCFAYVNIMIDGAEGGRSGDFATETVYIQSGKPFPDTLHISIIRHGKVGPPPGAPPSSTPDCP